MKIVKLLKLYNTTYSGNHKYKHYMLYIERRDLKMANHKDKLTPVMIFLNEFASPKCKSLFKVEDKLEDLAFTIREYQLKFNLTQQQVADDLELPLSVVEEIEKLQKGRE